MTDGCGSLAVGRGSADKSQSAGSLSFGIASSSSLRRAKRRCGSGIAMPGGARLGGPGGRQFDHETIDGELRGRRDLGPKMPGVPRLMVVGDSITYGLGVHDWRKTWPELLVQQLERGGRRHEMAVFALPGQDIIQHVDVMREWDSRVVPRHLHLSVVRQRHRGDLASSRLDACVAALAVARLAAQPVVPVFRARHSFWRQTAAAADAELRRLPARRLCAGNDGMGRVRAAVPRVRHRAPDRLAARRIMALYPQVPFRGRYPLQAIHDRMRALAGAHDLEIPPSAWIRSGATVVSDTDARWKQVLTVPARSGAGAIETPEYVFASGPLKVVVVARRTAGELDDDYVGESGGDRRGQRARCRRGPGSRDRRCRRRSGRSRCRSRSRLTGFSACASRAVRRPRRLGAGRHSRACRLRLRSRRPGGAAQPDFHACQRIRRAPQRGGPQVIAAELYRALTPQPVR